MHLFVFRNMCQAIVVEFRPSMNVYTGEEKATLFRQLGVARQQASSVIGQLIKLSGLLFSEEGFDYLDGVVAVEVSRLLENSLPRQNDTYSVWLFTLLKVILEIHTFLNGTIFYPHCSLCSLPRKLAYQSVISGHTSGKLSSRQLRPTSLQLMILHH